MAEQERTVLAEAPPAIRPGFADTLNILSCRLGQFHQWLLAPQVHRQLAAQRGETAVHFRADRTGQRPRRLAARPQGGLGEALGEVLGDGQGIPDVAILAFQQGHLAGRRILQDPLPGIGPPQRDEDLVERRPAHAQGQPAPQRPGRVIAIANHDGQGHAPLLFGRPTRTAMHQRT